MGVRTTRRLFQVIPERVVFNSKMIFLQSLVALLLGWYILSYPLGLVDTISAPDIVGLAVYELLASGDWIPHMIASMRRILRGFVVTLLIGTVLGIVMGWSEFWKLAFQDYVSVGLAFPSLFAVVFAAMWFGLSDITPVVAAAIIAFPFVTQNVYEGMEDMDTQLLKMSSAFEVSRMRVVWRSVIKAILPEWFAGARYAFAISWKITTLAELVSADSGVGYMIHTNINRLNLVGVMKWTILFTLVILLIEYGVFQQVEKRVFDWREETTIGFA